MRCAALNTGSSFHELDHIAPLAALLRMPLLVGEERNAELARRYYPQVVVEHWPDLDRQLDRLAARFDALFECKYWALPLKELFRQVHGKEMRLIFCPHGQSDKGFAAPLLAPYAWQDGALLYGDLLAEMLREVGVVAPPSARVGNYRLQFYQAHRSFYDALTAEEIPLSPRKRTLLYAPTWSDADLSTSFFAEGQRLADELPSDWNLVVKVHPLLEQRNPAGFYPVAAAMERRGAILVHEWPLVYPLLARADVYLGDASSIGYDFLWFDRPLYFFPARSAGRLRGCGTAQSISIKTFMRSWRGPTSTTGRRDGRSTAWPSARRGRRGSCGEKCGPWRILGCSFYCL